MRKSSFSIKLFYSYSHKDARHRQAFERALALLRRDVLVTWSDMNILPGKRISDEIEANIHDADIVVFLLSSHFIDSPECMKEWDRARDLETDDKQRFRVPVIISDCAWEDLLGDDDLKALPQDGKPVETFASSDTAWKQVYDGIKTLVDNLRNDLSPRVNFLSELQDTEVISRARVTLDDLFVFLPLSRYGPACGYGTRSRGTHYNERH